MVLWLCLLALSSAFVTRSNRPWTRTGPSSWLLQTTTVLERPSRLFSAPAPTETDPIVFASGSSTKSDLVEALSEAVNTAVQSLPKVDEDKRVINLAMVSVSSLYDGGIHQPATVVVPTLLQGLADNAWTLEELIGSSAAGCIGSAPSTSVNSSCRPSEWESLPSVTVTFCILPNVKVQTFHASGNDVPDDFGRYPIADFQRTIGLTGITSPMQQQGETTDETESPPVFLLLPSPAFSTELDDLLQGLSVYYPGSQIIGGIASTVSSLSRAKLFRWSKSGSAGASSSCWTEGCVGVALQGDIQLEQMAAQGAKPVGGIYQIIKGQDSTISVIVLDETATDALKEEEEIEDDNEDEEEEEEDDSNMDARARAAQLYAKARIPKPVLAEANFLMRTLSDDDQAFMRRQLLIGLEQGGSVGRTASELARLAQGEGHRFTVHNVASAGMKDGSVTMPLGSVDITPGTRLRFYVRESDFAKKEIDALWTGYKKRTLSKQFEDGNDEQPSFTPAACLLIPTLDRGNKFFLGKPGYESNAVARMLPGISCIFGFFSNGIIGKMDVSENAKTGVQGSSSGYFLLGSKSGRPVYSPAAAAASEIDRKEKEAIAEAQAREKAIEEEKRVQRAKAPATSDERAPRSDDGELILKRREVHSGRALTVSTVEWSVAEKTAQPTSALEGFMWDKETEVDRFRERVPLANLLSQCKLSMVDPASPKPRDWVGPLKQAAMKGFVVVPECKRIEPMTGSLRRRYDVGKLAREFTLAQVPVLSVNCDSVMFGGSLDDVTEARKATSAAAIEQLSGDDDGVLVPPILASDLLLYPYQLYKHRLAGADAVNLVAGALASKDLKYLTKIASSVQLQTLITVTSEVQIRTLLELAPGSFQGLIISNRELEDFSFDETGNQALDLLKSDALEELLKIQGDDFPVLVEGRVGIIEREGEDGSASAGQYIKELAQAGATGAIVGGGLAVQASDFVETLEALQASAQSS